MFATAAKSCGAPAVYHRCQPGRTLLCRVVQDHLASWLALHDDGCGGHAPELTEREFCRYLESLFSPTASRAPAAPIVATTSWWLTPAKIVAYAPSAPPDAWSKPPRISSITFSKRLPVRQWVLSLPKRHRYHLATPICKTPCCTASCAASNKVCEKACQKQTAEHTSLRIPTHASVPSSLFTAAAVCAMPTCIFMRCLSTACFVEKMPGTCAFRKRAS